MERLVLVALVWTMLLGMSGCGDATNRGVAVNDRATTALDASADKTTMSNLSSPEETLARMMELARAGDWESYVDDFYGEAHKFEGKADRRDALVARFRDQWADKLLSGFEPLEGKAAEVVDNGKKALFIVDGNTLFTLYLSEDGRWTFHL